MQRYQKIPLIGFVACVSSWQVINLSHDQIKGKQPTPINGIYNICILLAHNRFIGSIPSVFCEANYLQVLNLADNDLSGILPGCWDNLFYLRVFNDHRITNAML